MLFALVICAIAIALLASLFFSTLTYSLRDFVRARLAEEMDKRNLSRYRDSIFNHTTDFVFITAMLRLIVNLAILIGVLRLFETTHLSLHAQYLAALLITGFLTLFFSVLIPHAVARHTPEEIIIPFIPLLHVCRIIFLPAAKVMQFADRLTSRIVAKPREEQTEEVDQEILQAVAQGEQRGIVDEAERQMIESVIEFRDQSAGQVMTPRTDIVALPISAHLAEVKKNLEDSGHSRLPVYENSLDQIIGILHARDLLQYLGESNNNFDLRAALHSAFYVPETKPLQELLQDFRLQKIHLAIVLDEFGGTAGLVTIEDVLEELVGEIADEHEPAEPAMIKKIDDNTFDADARIGIPELNRLAGLSLPEDAGYDTLGGFASIALGHVGRSGESFRHLGHLFTVLDAEPQCIHRVRIQLAAAAATSDHK
ncbi:MAG TPA: hemolysin family protein [Tepidisphaeraceae bacterium]|nr:hemolysin family protein [Tepidisphaeraceae bacterium]